MKHRNGLICGTAIVVLSVWLASCRTEPPAMSGRGPAAVEWKERADNSKDPAAVESLWNAKIAHLGTDPKNHAGSSLDELVKILRSECSQVERDELLEYAASSPGGNSKQGFPRSVIEGLIWLYIEDEDRHSLIRVLAKACPRKVGLRDVEDVVVRQGRSPKIEDAVTVLFDAYELSQSPDARSAIATALRRGFAFAGPLPADDVELVAWCRTWYSEHRATVEFNPEYSLNSSIPQRDRYQEQGLFIPRTR